MLAIRAMMGAASGGQYGQQAYTTAGTFTFTVPAGVTSICAVCIGGGRGGDAFNAGTTNDGGSLSYSNSIAVTPGESLTVVVGAGGTGHQYTGAARTNGGDSRIHRAGSNLVLAKGGGSASSNIGTAFAGGQGDSGGGGAGGYSAVGGNGAAYNGVGSAGSGGSAGGGGGGTGYIPVPGDLVYGGGGGGGGVDLYGTGSSGAGGTIGVPNVSTGGGGGRGSYVSGATNGSGGTYAYSGAANANPGGNGGEYGGGGGSGGYFLQNSPYVEEASSGGNGGVGGVRIIWGSGRSFPSNAADV